MADVFVSFEPEDRSKIEPLLRLLTAFGFSLELRQEFAGFPIVGSTEIEQAGAVIVVWSRISVASGPVVLEARQATDRGILVPVVIEEVEPPPRFRGIQSFDLTNWTGAVNDSVVKALFGMVRWLVLRSRKRTSQGSRPATPPASGILSQGERSQDATSSGRHVINSRDDCATYDIARSVTESPPGVEASGVISAALRLLPTVFICYRRDDTQDAAGRLRDRLVDAYDSERVFMDIESVPLGIDFVDHVAEQISRCSAVIVMIGKQWLKAKDRNRRRRLDDPDDLVRAEIAAALRQKIPVIPVLVQNATMPTAADLPDDIRLLARRNGIALRHEQWREGVERLLKELNPVMGRKQ